MKPIRLVAPSLQPVSIEDVKAQARIDYSDDDVTLANMVTAATQMLDGYGGLLGRAIMQQTWQQPFAYWSRTFQLPMPGARNVAINYTDQDGNTQAVAGNLFEVIEGHSGSIVRLLTDFTSPSLKTDVAQPIKIDFTCGAQSRLDVDYRIKQAIVMMVTHWDAFRGVTAERREAASVPWGFEAIIAPLRWRPIG